MIPASFPEIAISKSFQRRHVAKNSADSNRRRAPSSGLRPTVRFTIAAVLTLAWVAFSVWVSAPWRDDLELAIGPVMAWVIPIFLAYIPGLVIGFMIFTLLITRYRALALGPPAGDWPDGEWPAVTILIAAWNEGEAIVPTLERIAELTYEGRVEVVVADNNSTDDTAALADARASGSASTIGASSSRSRASTTPSTPHSQR